MENYYAKKQESQRGFALLFAVLTGSMLLSVGLAIFSIALKELDLSTAGRESQYAFYAADSGLECALYYDGQGAFPENSDDEEFSSASIICPSNLQSVDNSSYTDSDTAITTFQFYIPQSDTSSAPCAIVSVEKELVLGGAEGEVSTTIVSRGYNTCRAGAQQVERALQAVY